MADDTTPTPELADGGIVPGATEVQPGGDAPEQVVPLDEVLTGEQPAEAEPVPTGSAKAVLAWVGDDAVKAQAALDAELAQDKARGGLVKDLQKLLGVTEPVEPPVVPSDPDDPRVGTMLMFAGEPAFGAEQVSFEDGEYVVDPDTAVILHRL